jgi:hypothetical protein
VSRYWRCRRVTAGEVCGELNLAVKKKCYACGKPKPPKRKPKHMSALELNYVEYVKLNGGERCGICGAVAATRRLHRDHDHRTGAPRGLLCFRCNTALPNRITPDWLRSAAVYLERAMSP